MMAIGNQGTGVGSVIKGYNRRGGKWLREKHNRHATTILTDEHMTSQTCVYCFSLIHHPILRTTRCLNPECPAVQNGYATNNRDAMSAMAIGLSMMSKYILEKDLPAFTQY
jgi:hypothetical protein